MIITLIVECNYGEQTWFLNGDLHRDNAAACIRMYGYKVFYRYGKRIKSETNGVVGR